MRMPIGRFLLASAVLFITALVWNGFVQLVLLREANQALQGVRRPDVADLMWLSLLLTAGLAVVFVAGYARFAREGTVREGVLFGLFVAVLAGLLVDLNQYILYPIPGSLAAKWFLGGLFEFSLYGALVAKLYPVDRR